MDESWTDEYLMMLFGGKNSFKDETLFAALAALNLENIPKYGKYPRYHRTTPKYRESCRTCEYQRCHSMICEWSVELLLEKLAGKYLIFWPRNRLRSFQNIICHFWYRRKRCSRSNIRGDACALLGGWVGQECRHHHTPDYVPTL